MQSPSRSVRLAGVSSVTQRSISKNASFDKGDITYTGREAGVSSHPMKTTLRSRTRACAALALALAVCADHDAHAQSAPRPPQFKVDPAWPTIPNNWVLSKVTSISVDRNDNVWVLHVPQSIPEAQHANATPPMLEFDGAGKLLQSWGGP